MRREMRLPKYFRYDLFIKVNAELVCRRLPGSGRGETAQ